MEYNFLIEQNKEYKDLQEEYNQILNKKRDALIKLNNETIKALDLESLDYIQLKELMDSISYNIDIKLKEKLKCAYLSKKPLTNKIVEKMDFLNKDKKVKLDENLSYFKNRYITYSFWSKIAITEDVRNKILTLLKEEDIIRIDYKLYCSNCSDSITTLTDDDLNKIKEYEEIKAKITDYEKNSTEEDDTPAEIKELYYRYYDLVEYENNPLIYCCYECDHDNEFKSLEELLKYTKETYFIK